MGINLKKLIIVILEIIKDIKISKMNLNLFKAIANNHQLNYRRIIICKLFQMKKILKEFKFLLMLIGILRVKTRVLTNQKPR